MAKCNFRDGTVLSDFEKPYIVAEVNTSHNGNIDTAKKMIEQAKEAGCSCVKFQSWSQESLYSKTYYNENPIAKRIVSKFAFSEAELLEVARHSKDCGIAFSSTPYSRKEVDFLLEKCEAPYVKVASMDLNNYAFLEYIAKTGTPIVLATGMSNISEVRKAVATIEDSGCHNICLLHCISIYPPKIKTIRLNNILGLRQEFPDYPVGFSDHSLGIEMPVAAVTMGAAMIEKHFTLDKLELGMDNQIALEPVEMASLVQKCQDVQIALGSTERIVLADEMEQRKKMRRSIIATKDLKAGTKLKKEDMDVKRPGTGMPPEKIKSLVGKILIRDIEGDTLIFETDILQ
jgi:sialic acid synthase SpsE